MRIMPTRIASVVPSDAVIDGIELFRSVGDHIKAYRVPSATRPGTYHMVTADDRLAPVYWPCTCEWGGAGGSSCQHVIGVTIYIQRQQMPPIDSHTAAMLARHASPPKPKQKRTKKAADRPVGV